MKHKSRKFFIGSENEWEDLGGGVSRQIAGYDDNIMMVKVRFDPGAVGTPHKHFHSQTTYVAEGRFEFTVGDEKKVVSEGDVVYMEGNIVHETKCLEAGMLIDVFSPLREDFLDGSKLSYFGKK